jgi:predicted TPR repeat methyltransferase
MSRKKHRGRTKEKTRQPSPSATRTAGDVPGPTDLHSPGIQSFREGQSEKAASPTTQAIAAESQPDFHYNLGILLKKQGKLEKAAASYQRAIALKPDYADAHNNLGNVLNAMSKRDEARASFERALFYKPGKANTHFNLAKLCRDAGDREAAVHHFRRCLECDPDDLFGARMILAHMDHAATPERASQTQLDELYKFRSNLWDGITTYFAYALVAEAFRDHMAGANPDILDIGCGTGLVGAHVRQLARRLDGVDLSAAMLEKAHEKQIYDRLELADLVFFMSEYRDSYDAILGAAILIHFGDLKSIFRAAHRCLRDKGLFVFTVFANEIDNRDFAVSANSQLAQNGCFRHSAGYVERLAKECGFSVAMLKTIIHERYPNVGEVSGLLVVLQRA